MYMAKRAQWAADRDTISVLVYDATSDELDDVRTVPVPVT